MDVDSGHVSDANAYAVDQRSPRCWLQFVCLLFGLGSWIAIAGLWVELPLLTSRLPESWKLGTNVTLVIQLANVGPLVYWIARRRNWCSAVTANHVQFFLGTIGCVLLVLCWNQTVAVGNDEYSIVLYVSTFLLSLVDCTSSTSFLPFMGRFANVYMTPYLVGEGLSGLIPTLVAIAQGIGHGEDSCPPQQSGNVSNFDVNDEMLAAREPRFSLEVFFMSLLVTLLVSWIAFIVLWATPCARRHQLANTRGYQTDTSHKLSGHKALNAYDREQSTFLAKRSGHLNWKDEGYRHALIILTWACFLTFGIMPSIQSYSSLPYSDATFHLSVIVNNVAFPVGCLAAMIVEIRSRHLINVITLTGTLFALYIGLCASLSPRPPLHDSLIGHFIMVSFWFTFTFLMSYAKTMVTLSLKDLDGDEGLFWVGMATQFGSVVGAVLMFVVVQYTHFFKKCL